MKKIKVLVGILGLDQHEVGAVAVAGMLRDAGMEVIYTSKFNLPSGIVKSSLQEDVDVIGLSCHSWEYLYYIPELMKQMKKDRLEIPVVLGGSVVTSEDSRKLMEMGVAATFCAGATSREIVETLQRLVRENDGEGEDKGEACWKERLAGPD